MQLLQSSSTEKMIGSNSLKMLVRKIIQADISEFEVNVSTHLQEKEILVQNLQKGSEAKDVKIVELNKKLEEQKVHFQAFVLDCKTKDEVIRALQVKVRDTNLTNSKKEKEINILVQMIIEEKAKAEILNKSETQETRDITEVRSILEDSITSEIQEKINESHESKEALSKDIAEYDNEDVLTENIELNESLEMEKCLEEKEVQDEYIPIQNQYMDTDLIESEEVSVEVAHTADALSNMIDSLLGKLNYNKYENHTSQWIRDLWSKGISLILAYL